MLRKILKIILKICIIVIILGCLCLISKYFILNNLINKFDKFIQTDNLHIKKYTNDGMVVSITENLFKDGKIYIKDVSVEKENLDNKVTVYILYDGEKFNYNFRYENEENSYKTDDNGSAYVIFDIDYLKDIKNNKIDIIKQLIFMKFENEKCNGKECIKMTSNDGRSWYINKETGCLVRYSGAESESIDFEKYNVVYDYEFKLNLDNEEEYIKQFEHMLTK